MSNNILSRTSVLKLFQGFKEELGNRDKERFSQLAELIGEEGKINLATALKTLYPNKTSREALPEFRNFRKRVNDICKEWKVNLRIQVDSSKKLPPNERFCLFEGEYDPIEDVEKFSREGASDVNKNYVESSGEILDFKDGKPVVRFFISYSHEDQKLKENFIDLLKTFLKGLLPKYYFELWADGDIPLGKNWHHQIQKAIQKSHFGLFLLSPSFFGSNYIRKEELPHFLPENFDQPDPRKPIIPVCLKDFRFGEWQDDELIQYQIFFDKDEKCFSDRQRNKKDNFVGQLIDKIKKLIDVEFNPGYDKKTEIPLKPTPESVILELQRKRIEELADFVPSYGHVTLMKKLRNTANVKFPEKKKEKVIDLMYEWHTNPEAPKLLALLGEYGIGKTTACKMFTLRVIEERRKDKSIPLPIYLDLRYLGAETKKQIDLERIIEVVVRKTWLSPEKNITAREIIQLVREKGATIIFDGLDEVLVHLSPIEGQAFIRELWSILAPYFTGEASRAKKQMGKILMACRSHYFKTVRDEINYFIGEEREALQGEDYRAIILLPFDDEQIRTYFQKNFKEKEVDRIIELIRSVHNLPDLATRPYTLRLIAEHIPLIERFKAEGKKITGATLYKHVVDSWIERDTGKHQILPEHKKRFMEYLARELWVSGKRSWSVEDVEQWLIDFLRTHPEINAHYEGKDREILKEDLRTATFLVREGEDQFRFAHTSLQEFFLASFLLNALLNNQQEDWAIPRPNREIFDFLGQLMLELRPEDRDKALKTMATMKTYYHVQASENLLSYILYAMVQNYPAPSMMGFDLKGAQLKGWQFSLSDKKLVLNNSDFSGADLRDAEFENAMITDCKFTGADLTRTIFQQVNLSGSVFQKVNLTGTILRKVNLTNCDFEDANFYRTQMILSDLMGIGNLSGKPDELFLVQCKNTKRKYSYSFKTKYLKNYKGHTGSINSISFSPDGQQLVSAGEDNTVILWDARSGEEILRLKGHNAPVNSVSFSPDGQRLISAGKDKTVILWDMRSSEEILRLKGHNAPVNSVSFSPDGQQLASASRDKTIILWSTRSGKEILELEGHNSSVNSVSFSPDGQRLVSAGNDHNVILWDVYSREAILTFKGHLMSVTSASFTPDGQLIVSAGWDIFRDSGEVILWDAHNGEEILKLKGHNAPVNSVSFSPDGQRLASADLDGVVILYDVRNGEELLRLKGHRASVNSVSFSPDGQRLASAGEDNTVILWDAWSGEEILRLNGYNVSVLSVDFSSRNQRLASTGLYDVVIWGDVLNGEKILRLTGHIAPINLVRFSPDGQKLVSADLDGVIILYDTGSGKEVLRHKGHKSPVNSVSFSPDGRRLASADLDGVIILYDTGRGKEVLRQKGHKSPVNSVSFSPDGQRLAYADLYDVIIWKDAPSGREILRLRGHNAPVNLVSFSLDGQRLASADLDGVIILYEARSGQEILKLKGHKSVVNSVSFSSDGQRVASAGGSFLRDSGEIILWDARSGEKIIRLKGYNAPVLSVNFSPDGKRLASAGWDGTILVWDLQTMKPVKIFYHLPNGEKAAFTLKNGKVEGILYMSENAWRYLGWVEYHPELKKIVRWPFETISLPRAK